MIVHPQNGDLDRRGTTDRSEKLDAQRAHQDRIAYDFDLGRQIRVHPTTMTRVEVQM